MTLSYFWNAKLRVRRGSFGVRRKSLICIFSNEINVLNNHQGNSRFDNYFRVFLGDCTDFQKITEILRIEQYFQVFTGDFNNLKKNMENSRIERYFQVFTGDFNDFNKIIENSAIETYFQVFTGDFTD